MAKSAGLTAIFNGPDAGIVYADQTLDLTLYVTQCLDAPEDDQKCRVSAPPPAIVALVDLKAVSELSTLSRRLNAAVAAGTDTREGADAKFENAIGVVAKDLGVQLVFNTKTAGLLSTTASLDVTTEIVSRLNRLSP